MEVSGATLEGVLLGLTRVCGYLISGGEGSPMPKTSAPYPSEFRQRRTPIIFQDYEGGSYFLLFRSRASLSGQV